MVFLKGWPFRDQVEHSPQFTSLPCTSITLPFVRQGLHILLLSSIPSSIFFYKHNFHPAPPHHHLLVAFELDQRQDGSTLVFSS